MKKLNMQILLAAALLGNALSMQGMRSIYSRGTVRRPTVIRPRQSWRDWFSRKMWGFQSNILGQRGYGTTPRWKPFSWKEPAPDTNKLIDELNRYDYKRAKAKWMSDDYNRRTGADTRIADFLPEVNFDEIEYHEWLQSDKDPNFFYEPASFRGKFRFNFDQQGEFGYQEKSIQSLLGLSDTASTAEIKAKFYAFMKQYHPDQWPKNITKEEREVIEKKVKEVTAAWNEYKKELKQQ